MQCAEHEKYFGAWACEPCGKLLCDLCVKSRPTRLGAIRTCLKCDAVVFEAPRVLLEGSRELADLAKRPFAGEAILRAALYALPWALADFVTPTAFLGFRGLVGGWTLRAFLLAAWVGATTAYVFQIVDHIGKDQPELPFNAHDISSRWDLLRWVVRGLLCATIGYGPAVLIGAFGADVLPLAGHVAALVVAGLFGAVCLPASMLAVLFTGHTLNGLWPFAWARIISNSPRAFFELALRHAAIGVLWALVVLPIALFSFHVPLLGKLVAGTLTNVLLFVQATLVGGFVRRHAEEFGYDKLAPQ